MIFTIKIDVDTERGTRIGVPNFAALLRELKIPATFLFSLGPDNTGRAIKRIFRRGFLSKVKRTSVVSTYGFATLLNGVLLPGPHIGRKHEALMRDVAKDFEVGIHAYDHQRWQDGVAKMSQENIAIEFMKARNEFSRIFNKPALTAGAPGWQANSKTLNVYDEANFSHASDCRGVYPFMPKDGTKVFRTLQIPTTLPTLDELLGKEEFPLSKLSDHFISLLSSEHPNVMTVHAELEGMKYLEWFKSFLLKLKARHTEFMSLEMLAQKYLSAPETIPVCEMKPVTIEGRSGLVAGQIVIS